MSNTDLPYIANHSPALLDQVRALIRENALSSYIANRYPEAHTITSDKALFKYVQDLKQQHFRNAPAVLKVGYDNRLDITHQALGLHNVVSRVQGPKLKAKNEIRIASLYKTAPAAFLRVIVVHELAHLKERHHEKSFYALCEHVQPGYHQLDFDMRLYLTSLDIEAAQSRSKAAAASL